MRIRAAVLEETGGSLSVEELELAPPGPGRGARAPARERDLPLRPERDRRHRPGAAARRCSATRAPASSRRSAPGVRRVAVGDHVALSWAPSCGECAECLRELPHLCSTAWPAMGAGDAARRDLAALARRRDRSTTTRSSRRSREACVAAGALVRADPARRAVRGRRPRRLRDLDRRSARSGAPPACGPAIASRSSAAAASGSRRCSARSPPAPATIVAVDVSAAEARLRRASSAPPTACCGRARAEATAEAVREASGGGVDYAIEATGRTEAMLAAFLSTRARGAAVLIGIPRPDAVLSLPALTIPRMERRVLGSIYGSTYPERDFALTLDLYRRGRLPLDRLITHRVPLEHAARDRPAAQRRGDPRGHRHGRRLIVTSTSSTDASARAGADWPGRQPRQRRARAPRQPDRGGRDRHVRAPRARPHAGAGLRRGASRLRADLAADADDEQVDRARGALQTLTWGAAQLGIGQGVLDASPTG